MNIEELKNCGETLSFEVEDKIGFLTINRPDKLNALNTQVLRDLASFFNLLGALPLKELLGVIVTGAGEKAFIAGADISEMNGLTSEGAKTFGELGQEVTFLIEECPFPIVMAVNGFALGGGCEMALSGDFILATENAVFGQPEVKLGLIPGFGGTQRLSKIVGRNRAKEIIFTGRNVKAQEAKEIGLALNLFPNKEELLSGAKALLNKMASNSPMAIKIAKKVINEGVDLDNPKGLALELDNFSKIFSSHDMAEGTKAFMEKRAPTFKGE